MKCPALDLHVHSYSIIMVYLEMLQLKLHHTGKCIHRFGGIYAYCRYFNHRPEVVDIGVQHPR